MKKIIVVTGGAGFVGANLIEYLLKKTSYNIISIDNYSSGTKKNQIKDKRVKYIRADTRKISKVLENKKKNIHSLFHFGEFSRIYQSFKNMNKCIESNSIGTHEVFNFCLKNKIKLIYSATSASLGNKGEDKNLSPYAFTKSKNLEMLENLKKWFNFKFEIIYFYNVYGPKQISIGKMATVIGIFEDKYINNKCKHYSISNKKSYTILEVAKMFKKKIVYLQPRSGERYASALTNLSLSNKVHKRFGKISIKKYIEDFIKNNH